MKRNITDKDVGAVVTGYAAGQHPGERVGLVRVEVYRPDGSILEVLELEGGRAPRVTSSASSVRSTAAPCT